MIVKGATWASASVGCRGVRRFSPTRWVWLGENRLFGVMVLGGDGLGCGVIRWCARVFPLFCGFFCFLLCCCCLSSLLLFSKCVWFSGSLGALLCKIYEELVWQRLRCLWRKERGVGVYCAVGGWFCFCRGGLLVEKRGASWFSRGWSRVS